MQAVGRGTRMKEAPSKLQCSEAVEGLYYLSSAKQNMDTTHSAQTYFQDPAHIWVSRQLLYDH